MTIKCKSVSGPESFGYVAEPEGTARGGVLLLPTIFGVNEFAKQYAETLARNGLVGVVWDINSGVPPSTDYQECIRRARTLTDEGVAAMLTRWLDTLTEDFGLTAVAVIGFCIGGRFALLQAAADKRLRACGVAYPSIENPKLANQTMDVLALVAGIACPVLMLRPGHDHVSTPETYDTLTRALLKRSAPTEIHYHPEAEHGFMHRKVPEANVAATKLASPQLIAFLKACLD